MSHNSGSQTPKQKTTTLFNYWRANAYHVGSSKRKREDNDEPSEETTKNLFSKTKKREKDETSNAWDDDSVKLPCSKHNVFYSKNNRPLSKWYTIQTVLEQEISSSRDFEEAVMTINSSWKNTNFNALHDFFACHVPTDDYKRFFEVVLPRIQKLALDLPNLIPQAIPLLSKNQEKTVSLTTQQIACLLAHALFCTFPRRNAIQDPDDEYFSYPSINFTTLFKSAYKTDLSCPPLTVEKLKCLLFGYFEQVTAPDFPYLNNIVTFERRCITMETEQIVEMWESSQRKLIPFDARVNGSIEDDAPNTSQVDFANKMIGGGVLGRGCVQEEIRFLVNADCIISRLFSQELEDNECILIRGSVRYSYYSGYGDTFQYKGVFNQDQTPQEEEIVAIDALNFRDPHSALTLTDQYKTSCILRELQKAYVGFERPNMPDKPVATGNWGCGVFGGNFQIKSLIQWMAASEAGRTKLIYFAYGDADLADDLKDITSWLIGVEAKVGELYEAIGNYRVELRREKKSVSQYPLFKYVKSYFEILRGIVAPTQVVDLTDTQIEERDMREMIVDNVEKEQPIEEKTEQQPVEEIKN